MTKEEFSRELPGIFWSEDPFPKSEPLDRIIQQYWHKHRVAQEVKPSSILEYGVRGGYSAWSFLKAVPRAECVEYVGVDLYERRPNDTLPYYRNHAVNLLAGLFVPYRLYTQDTCTFLPLAGAYDLFHADASHDAVGVSQELKAFFCLREGGVALVDDGSVPAVLEGVRAWMKEIGRKEYLYIDDLRGQVLLPKSESQLSALAAQLSDCAVIRSF